MIAGLARTLERVLFGEIFIADVIGYCDVYQGSAWHAIREAVQIPVNGPIQLVSAMALVTEHLGFGIAASAGFEHPDTFARRVFADTDKVHEIRYFGRFVAAPTRARYRIRRPQRPGP